MYSNSGGVTLLQYAPKAWFLVRRVLLPALGFQMHLIAYCCDHSTYTSMEHPKTPSIPDGSMNSPKVLNSFGLPLEEGWPMPVLVFLITQIHQEFQYFENGDGILLKSGPFD